MTIWFIQDSMYNPSRLMWQSGDSTFPRTPEYFWWSCKAVNECLDSANRLLAASPRPRSPKVFGGFCFVRPSDSRYVTGPEWADKSEYTDIRTHPLHCRPALIERLVKDWVHGGNKALSISESIRQAHLGLIGFSNVNRSK